MAPVQIFWDPLGFELDQLGEKRYLADIDHDGDSPQLAMAVRMLYGRTRTQTPRGDAK